MDKANWVSRGAKNAFGKYAQYTGVHLSTPIIVETVHRVPIVLHAI
jgi:hypothetical protein